MDEAAQQPGNGFLGHLLGLAVYAGGAFAGLLTYQVGGGIMRWITPFWWGRQGMTTLMIASIAVSAAAIPCYLITRALLHRAWMTRLPRRYELAALLCAGLTQGFLLWPIADWTDHNIAWLSVTGRAGMPAKLAQIFGFASIAGAMIAAALGALACYAAARLRGRL